MNNRQAKKKQTQTDNAVANALEQHEQICAMRYENIEKRLEAGSQKFVRIEAMIIGIYVLIISTQVIAQVFG